MEAAPAFCNKSIRNLNRTPASSSLWLVMPSRQIHRHQEGSSPIGLSKPHVLSEKVTSHSTVCVVDQEQRTIEVLEIDASVLLNGPSKRFSWPKFLPHIDAVILCYDASEIASFRGMSELLENFAVANLSTVMLACKSEVHPKRSIHTTQATWRASTMSVSPSAPYKAKRARSACAIASRISSKKSPRLAVAVPAVGLQAHCLLCLPPWCRKRSLSPGSTGPAPQQSRTASCISQASQADSQGSLARPTVDTAATWGEGPLGRNNDGLPSPAAPSAR